MENIGIFIDAENISYNDLPYIMMEIKNYGRIILARIYGDWSDPMMEKWKQYLISYALEPVHCAKLPRKNSVDIKIIDDIYDILYLRNCLSTYILVSNDIDYLTVGRKIKLFGKNFVTFGYANCSEMLKNVSDKFVNISLLNFSEEKNITLEVENIFEDEDTSDEEIEIKKTGDEIADNIFDIMANEKHYPLKELKNKLKKRLNINSDELQSLIKNNYNTQFRIAEVYNTNKEKIYDITSINSDVHKTVDEQFLAVFQMSDSNEIILSQFKEKLALLINNFDQRIWGFKGFKDMIKTMFVGKFDIVDRGTTQYIKNLIF